MKHIVSVSFTVLASISPTSCSMSAFRNIVIFVYRVGSGVVRSPNFGRPVLGRIDAECCNCTSSFPYFSRFTKLTRLCTASKTFALLHFQNLQNFDFPFFYQNEVNERIFSQMSTFTCSISMKFNRNFTKFPRIIK